MHFNIFFSLLKPAKSLWTLNKRSVFTPQLMTLSMTVSKTTTPLGTWNPATAPLFICLHPPLALFFFSHAPSSPILPYSIKRALCRYLGVLCWSVKVTHFLVIWYNNRKTAFSFTWKEQHGEEEGGRKGEGRVWGMVELHAGKGTWRKQTTMLLFTHTNNPHLCSSCDKSLRV